MAISTNVKDWNASRSPLGVSAYYPIAQTDWGVVGGGAAPTKAVNADGTGGMGMGTTRFCITWITAQGESTRSLEDTQAVNATDALTLTIPAAPTNGAAVIGFRIYTSQGAANSCLLNTAALSTVQAQQNFTTTQGTLLGFPIATTAVKVLLLGTGAGQPTLNRSGVQPPLPSCAANTTTSILCYVPLNFSVSRAALVTVPNANAETAGLGLVSATCVAPLWPASTAVVAGDNPTAIVINSNLFICSVAGTTAAANAFPAGFATAIASQTIGTTVTDNTATWIYYGKRKCVRMNWENLTGSAAVPAINEYNLWQTG